MGGAIIPAASLIVLRDRADGPPDLLVVERAAHLAFAPGAMVFPGGRVDPADRGHVAADDDGAARIAAVRETLEETGIAIGADALTPFARWRPDDLHRRFDTRFFLARAPIDAPMPRADGQETARAWWASAADLLAAADGGTLSLIYPTRRMLERLAQHRDARAAIEDATRWPTRTITPRVERRGGIDQLCIPGGLGYPITAEPVDVVRRG